MDFSKIKLVVADMDGTLLNSQGAVSKLFFDLHDELIKHDIQFVAASGRQYYSIIHKLEPIKDDIIVIAENGGIAVRKEEAILTECLEQDTIHELLDLMRTIDDAHMVLCGRKQAYVESDDSRFLEIFKEYYHKYKRVDNLNTVTDDEFFKIAVYSFGGSENTTYPKVKHLESNLKVKVSGENWLDLSSMKADKGNALRQVQKKLNIGKEETMVFGDYNNDLEMLDLAEYSFAMQNAHPNVHKAAKYKTESNDELGVENVLKRLVSSRSI